MKPPSPQTASTRRSGWISAAIIAEGRPAPIVARALSSSSVFDMRRAVVAGEPDLVHAVVEGDDPVGRHHRPHVGDDALRHDREAVDVGSFREVPQDAVAQR